MPTTLYAGTQTAETSRFNPSVSEVHSVASSLLKSKVHIQKSFIPSDVLSPNHLFECPNSPLNLVLYNTVQKTGWKVNCNSYKCEYCGPRKGEKLRTALVEYFKRWEWIRLFTFTLSSSFFDKINLHHKCLMEIFRRFNTELRRMNIFTESQKKFSYIRVLEPHKSGYFHLHCFFSNYFEIFDIYPIWNDICYDVLSIYDLIDTKNYNIELAHEQNWIKNKNIRIDKLKFYYSNLICDLEDNLLIPFREKRKKIKFFKEKLKKETEIIEKSKFHRIGRYGWVDAKGSKDNEFGAFYVTKYVLKSAKVMFGRQRKYTKSRDVRLFPEKIKHPEWVLINVRYKVHEYFYPEVIHAYFSRNAYCVTSQTDEVKKEISLMSQVNEAQDAFYSDEIFYLSHAPPDDSRTKEIISNYNEILTYFERAPYVENIKKPTFYNKFLGVYNDYIESEPF